MHFAFENPVFTFKADGTYYVAEFAFPVDYLLFAFASKSFVTSIENPNNNSNKLPKIEPGPVVYFEGYPIKMTIANVQPVNSKGAPHRATNHLICQCYECQLLHELFQTTPYWKFTSMSGGRNVASLTSVNLHEASIINKLR